MREVRGRTSVRRVGGSAALLSLLGVLGLVGCVVSNVEARVPDPATYAAALTAATNAAREAQGLDPLLRSGCAAGAAGDRSAALAGGADLTHAPLTGVIGTCGPSTTAAENLSRASAPAGDVVDAWMESPGHRANVVDPALTELGVACVDDGDAMLCSAVFLGP